MPGWKETAVPRRLGAGEVQALLGSCDRATPDGKRDLGNLADVRPDGAARRRGRRAQGSSYETVLSSSCRSPGG